MVRTDMIRLRVTMWGLRGFEAWTSRLCFALFIRLTFGFDIMVLWKMIPNGEAMMQRFYLMTLKL